MARTTREGTAAEQPATSSRVETVEALTSRGFLKRKRATQSLNTNHGIVQETIPTESTTPSGGGEAGPILPHAHTCYEDAKEDALCVLIDVYRRIILSEHAKRQHAKRLGVTLKQFDVMLDRLSKLGVIRFGALPTGTIFAQLTPEDVEVQR